MMRRVLAVVAVLAGVGLGLLAWKLPDFQRMGVIGSSYVAKTVCSCIFVAGRSAEACGADLLPTMAQVRFEPREDGVRAWLPLLAERVARHTPGRGCTLE